MKPARERRGVVGRPAAGVVDLPDRRHLAVRLAIQRPTSKAISRPNG
jgi:hypothetical protein